MWIGRFVEQLRALVTGYYYSPILLGNALFLVARDGCVLTPIEAVHEFERGVRVIGPNSYLIVGERLNLTPAQADLIQVATLGERATTPQEQDARKELLWAVGNPDVVLSSGSH